MKRLFTLGLLGVILCCQQASAQLGKGQVSLGGSVGAATSKSNYEEHLFGKSESKNNSFQINPHLAFGVGGNWIVGLRPGFAYSKGEGKTNGTLSSKGRSQSFIIGAVARKFYPFGERFGLFAQAGVEYNFNENKNLMTGFKNKSKGFDVSIRPGAYLKAGKRFIIETTVGYIGYGRSSSEPSTGEAKSTGEGFGFALANNLSLGFHVIL